MNNHLCFRSVLQTNSIFKTFNKESMLKIIPLIALMMLYVNTAFPQYNSWNTVGGNSNRTGYSEEFYDVGSFNFTYTAPYSIWGMPIFTGNGKFTTTRYTSLSPLSAMVVTFNAMQTSPAWTYGESSGVNIIMGFNNDKIYVRDFRQNGYDTIFALNASNGNVIWKSRFTVERGIIWTAVFTSEGDLIVPGSDTKRIMRINHINGDTVWTNNRIIPNTGAEGMCINGNTLYTWQGGITTPKTLLAIDVNTGVIKYSSPELPGDGDQEIPFTVSKSGVIYCIRDGGLMYAVKDNGSSLSVKWSREIPQPVGTYTQIAVGKDSSVYVPFGRKIFRLDHNNGAAIDSSIEIAASGTINPRFAIGNFGNVYVGNGASDPGEGKFFIFSRDLSSITFQQAYLYNYYCGPAFGGHLLAPEFLYTGAGTEIKSRFAIIDDISENISGLPDNLTLNQNYPNPFNPVTVIKFELKQSSNVILKVYNELGSEVATLLDEKRNAGEHSVNFDGSNLSSGVYFYKLYTDKQFVTKKMILAK